MKKIMSALLALALAVPAAVAVPAAAASSSWQSDDEMTALLSELNIMTGDDYGDFYLDSYVTRAEMAKVAVASSSYKNTVASGLQFSPFSDVGGSFWGAPYIQAAVSAGIVDGYIDGTFNPNGTVKYEEAINMMLKVLGYTNADFGASYPYGQVGMAQNLKMTDGINASIGDPLTRRDVARLVCNTLDTSMKNSTNDLISVHNCQILDDVTIIATQEEDKTLSDDEISTSNGKYRIDDTFDRSYIGCTGDLVVKDGKYFVAFSPNDDSLSEKYIVYSTLNDAILCYAEGDNTNIHQFKISSTTTCYKGSTAYTYSQLSSEMEMGDIIRVRYLSNGEIDYINYSEGNVEGPIKVTSGSWMSNFDTNSSTKVVREGVVVDESAIQMNDIIYYSSDLNMILAYTTKVTGIYENATPSKDSPQSVTISGVTYELEGVEAFNDLSSNGSINYGDTVTVLLGRDGKKIAGVATASTSATTTQVGYAIGSGKKDFYNSDGTTYSSYYIELVTADGTVYTYPTSTNQENNERKVIKAQLKDGVATIGVLSDSSLSGYVSYQNMTIGSKKVASDVKILDTTSSYLEKIPLYTKTYMQRIDGISLSSSQVAYYATNSSGEISELILVNVTGDMYRYGLVTQGYNAQTTGSTKIDIDSTIYETTSFQNLTRGTGAKVAIDSLGNISSAQQLVKYSGTVSELTSTYAEINMNKYLLSDKVKVYKKTDITSYSRISLNEAVSGNYSYTCYYDKTQDKGGRIRVIIAEEKD